MARLARAVVPGWKRATLPGEAPITGSWEKLENIRLGTMQLAKPGRQEVKVKPIPAGWAAMDLAWLAFQTRP